LSSQKVMKFWVEGFFRRVSIVIEGVVPVTAKVFVALRDRCDEGVPVTAKVFGDQPGVPVTAKVVFFGGLYVHVTAKVFASLCYEHSAPCEVFASPCET
jgi:hypothetical protein